MTPDFTNTNLPDIIELKDISTSYDKGQSYIIRDFNLLIEDIPDKGEFIVILGKSGCGKTTILKYIAGLKEPTSGQVLIRGRERDLSVPISVIFQEPSALEHYTVLKNVMLPLLYKGVPESEAADRAMTMIKAVGLDGHEHKYAKFGKLSGGQVQRVVIARSLIANPGIILMDEPNRGLDNETALQIDLLIADLWQKLQSTVILVTHNIDQAVFLGDNIYIMGGKPAKIVQHFRVPLPYPRTREIKRSREFLDLAGEIEEYLYQL
ncbi:MAG TPA: ABC transporter ATP-binding protein [bacterium]|nr:ABC transporter ATP-binding protein [bacterium]HOZ22870.1 ABC transporter ATP-binding protein [bacterium]